MTLLVRAGTRLGGVCVTPWYSGSWVECARQGSLERVAIMRFSSLPLSLRSLSPSSILSRAAVVPLSLYHPYSRSFSVNAFSIP